MTKNEELSHPNAPITPEVPLDDEEEKWFWAIWVMLLAACIAAVALQLVGEGIFLI